MMNVIRPVSLFCVFLATAIALSTGITVARANDGTTSSLEIAGMVTGFAPDRATGVMYPSDFSGPVYSVAGSSRTQVGWYSEKTQYPVVAPGANPLGFVGTVGISEFTFQQNGKTVGTLTTVSLARLVENNGAAGKTDFAKGILCAKADGIVIGGTGIYRNAAGSFATKSTVNLGLLTLKTKLKLTLWEREPESVPFQRASASCCRPAVHFEPVVCAGPAEFCHREVQHCGLISRGCRILKSPLRCVFR